MPSRVKFVNLHYISYQSETMNKLPLALSLALSIVFASCSTGESDNSLVINGELATLYVGSYMVLIPDTYYSTDGFISEPEALLHNAVQEDKRISRKDGQIFHYNESIVDL